MNVPLSMAAIAVMYPWSSLYVLFAYGWPFAAIGSVLLAVLLLADTRRPA